MATLTINLEHALHTLYTQFPFVLHSFCALVNHILHMCKMYVVSKILGTCAKCAQEVYICNMCAVCAQSSRYVQNMCSLRTILKICTKCAQFAHNPQDMCKICAVCAHKKKKKVQHQLLVTHSSTGQAQCSRTGAFFNVAWSQTPVAIQEDLLSVQLHCLK